MRNLLASAALAAALIVPGSIRAADAAADGKADISPFSLSAGVDFVTAYIFRGYELTDGGVIAQPYLQLNAKVYTKDDFSITPYIGNWNSIQSKDEPGNGAWFESDIYGGADFAFGKLTIGVIYTAYTYPDNAFGTVQEFGAKVSYDDTELAAKCGLPFGLKPYAAWYKETSDDNPGAGQDQYAEIGINPAIAPKDWPVSFNFPVSVGLSPDGFFTDSGGHNEPFGYVSAGAYVTYPLPLPAQYGTWAIYGGATYYYLSADSVQLAGGEDRDYEIVGKAGLTFGY